VNAGVVNNGMFKITGGSVAFPELAAIVVIDKKKTLPFFLENSEITITGKFESFDDLIITGSKSQNEFKSLNDSLSPLNLKYSELYKKYLDARQANIIKKSAELQGQLEAIDNDRRKIQKDFLKTNPGSFVAPLILRNLISLTEPSEMEIYINDLDPAVARSPVIVQLKERVAILKKVEVGQKAPDFTLNDPEGRPVSLSSKIGTNLLLVDFWAAWCSPCRTENPNVVKVWKEFNKKGFDVYGVSLDQKKEDWVNAIADDKLTWTHVSDLLYWSNAAAKLYGVNSIPANFLLNKEGIIIARNLRGEALYTKVKELIGSK
jgi:peroxiredoxin